MKTLGQKLGQMMMRCINKWREYVENRVLWFVRLHLFGQAQYNVDLIVFQEKEDLVQHIEDIFVAK